MNETSLNLGLLQVSLRAIRNAICWPVRKLAGTDTIHEDLQDIKNHIAASTGILHIIVADLSANWSVEKRLRIQKYIANFTILDSGLRGLEPSGNPFTNEELQYLRDYTEKAKRGEMFTPTEARYYKELSDRAASEYPGQDWVAELLKLALFIFALYVLADILKPKEEGSS